MMNKVAITGIAACLLLNGCASIVSDSTYPVTINSTPPGVEFEIKNESGVLIHKGRTPTTITLKASDGYFDGADYTINFKKEGYEPQTATLSSKLDGWYLGNILFGGLIGILIVDPATGAMWKLPKNVSVSLYEKHMGRSDNTRRLMILAVDQLPARYRKMLIRIN